MTQQLLDSLSRAGLIEWLLDDSLPRDLKVLARAAFQTSSTDEIRELAGLVLAAERGENVDERAGQLGEASGDRALASVDEATGIVESDLGLPVD